MLLFGYDWRDKNDNNFGIHLCLLVGLLWIIKTCTLVEAAHEKRTKTPTTFLSFSLLGSDLIV
jgi:hypothetical protein